MAKKKDIDLIGTFGWVGYCLLVVFILWQGFYVDGDTLGLPLIGALWMPLYVGMLLIGLSAGVGIIVIGPLLALYGFCLLGAVDFISKRYTARPWQGITLAVLLFLTLLIRDGFGNYKVAYNSTYNDQHFTMTIAECMQKFAKPYSFIFCPRLVERKMYETTNPAFCNTLPEEDAKRCILLMAANTKNIDLCNFLPRDYTMYDFASCIVRLAADNKDPTLCKKIPPQTGFYDEQSCIVQVAIITHNQSFCSLVTDHNQHAKCIDSRNY